jgi:DNA-binding GntR family transcriptional regulator
MLEGTLPSGSELRQRDLAETFNVSPTPVREALNRLQAEGYVEARLHGTSIVRPTVQRRQENWRIRASLEALAAEMATERLTSEDLNEIAALADDFAQSEDDQQARRINRAFHFRIYQAAGSPVLLRFLEDLWRALDVAPNSYRRHEASARQHFAIVKAMRAGDPAKAAALTRAHISKTASRTEEHPAQVPDPLPRAKKQRTRRSH